MKRYLPDVNAILALLDPMHVHHDAAHRWYKQNSPMQFLLSPHVENGVIRVASQPKYPNCLGTCSKVREVLQAFAARTKSQSCEHEVSLLDNRVLLKPDSLTPARVSDLYLLALAAANRARFATFDKRIPADAVMGGGGAIEVIPVNPPS
jgi:predicted nucleic acid-binding protein